MSLRRRLVGLVVGLSAIGLVISGVVGTLLLRSFALGRVDHQLASFGRPPATVRDDVGDLAQRCDRILPTPRGILVEVYAADGTRLCAPQADADPGGGPQLTATDLRHTPDVPFTVNGAKGSHNYRVVVRAGTSGTVVVRAIDLADANATWREQALVEIAVGAVLLAVLAGLGLFFVRRDLRPLDDITETADAIAKGDRSQRVAVDQPHTEVGRLGTAFNTMLGSIEEAFHEQQRSEEMLRRFVADASHELRTPLTSIRGYAELYGAGGASTPERLEAAMGHIEREATRMSGLVDDLLLLAKLDQEATIVLGEVELVPVVVDALSDFHVADPTREITTSLRPDVTVIGDEARLRQVVANLLANVRVHTPASAPVEVTLDTGAGEAELRIIDHGAGIPADQRAMVFERFARLDRSRTRATGGSGLGLAIVKGLVDAHHGRVEVVDSPGGGATFVVRLPLVGPTGPAAASTDVASRAAEPPDGQLEPLTVR